MTTASLPRKTSRTEPAAATAPAVAAPQHHGLFLEPHFAPGSRALEDDEYEDGYEGDALPAPEPSRPARRR